MLSNNSCPANSFQRIASTQLLFHCPCSLNSPLPAFRPPVRRQSSGGLVHTAHSWWSVMSKLLSFSWLLFVLGRLGTACILGLGSSSASAASKALARWDTACKFGGLLVSKGPLLVSDDRCDWIYPKEDWQEKPGIKYPKAKEVRKFSSRVFFVLSFAAVTNVSTIP